MQLLNGLSYSMLLFMLAAGMSVIFGLMEVLNLAHGSLYLLGAYVGFSIARATGNFWLALVTVPLVIGALGALLETGFLRPLYRRGHLDQALLTFGFVFILMDVMKLVWGSQILSVQLPPLLGGGLQVGGLLFPVYRVWLIVLGLVLGLGLWLVQERTLLGAILRAGVTDREMAAAMGINVSRVFTLVFAGGAALAGLAGVVAGPILGMNPGDDFKTLIITLIVVVVGGLGTLAGAFWGALLVGLTQTFGQILFPTFDMFTIYAVLALVLIVRPTGLFGREV